MCDPLTIGGIALAGISAGINNAAQQRVQKARDDAMAAERIRQQGLDKEAAALNVRSQDRYQDFQGQQDKKSEGLKQYFTGQQVAEPLPEASLPTTSSNITVQEESKQRGQARDFTDRTGNALGELRAFGDLLGDVSRLQGRDASLIGQVGSFKRGSQGVLPLELEAANQKGNGLRMFGDIVGGLGGLSLNAGLGGKSLGGLFGGAGGAAPTVASTAATAAASPVLSYGNLYPTRAPTRSFGV